MNAATVVGYSYNADSHCIACTKAAVDIGQLPYPRGGPPVRDENLIPVEAQDSEGNPIHPIFGGDEVECDCRECGATIIEH